MEFKPPNNEGYKLVFWIIYVQHQFTKISMIRREFICGKKIARGRTKIASALTRHSRLEKINLERINQNPKDLLSGSPATISRLHHASTKTLASLRSNCMRWGSWRMNQVWQFDGREEWRDWFVATVAPSSEGRSWRIHRGLLGINSYGRFSFFFLQELICDYTGSRAETEFH